MKTVMERIMEASHQALINNKTLDTFEVTIAEYRELVIETQRFLYNPEPQPPIKKTYKRNGFFTDEYLEEVDHHAPLYLQAHKEWEAKRNKPTLNDMIVNAPSGPVRIVIK
jgi:hypothetical protein